MTDYFVGIDVSTSATKALLIDAAGRVVALASTEYAFKTPRPLWCEQDPVVLWESTAKSLRRMLGQAGIDPGQIAAVGLTGQMHGPVFLDARGNPLRPCIMWNDQRTGAECAEITERVGPERVIALTGNPILTGFTAPKIRWVQKHEPEVFRETASILLPKDYVRYRLTGGMYSDVSDASGTCLFDVARRVWSEEMLAALELRRDQLPEVTESPVVSARVSRAAAEQTGLVAGTLVVGGAGDQAAQAVGTGISREGVASVTLGTSGVVFASSDKYRAEPQGRLHAFCHAVRGKWHLMGVVLSAGGSLRWYRDVLGQLELDLGAATKRDVYDLLTEQAARAPAGCEGLLFLPYLTGERTPYADPNARGAFVGLTLRHSKAHMTRAVLEGVTYALRDSVELMRGMGLPLSQIRVSGGGSRSALWRQILADVFDVEIATVNVSEGAAYGAALLAAVGAGIYPGVDAACAATVHVTGITEPDAAKTVYAEMYPLFRALYPALCNEFQAIAETVAGHAQA